MSLSIEFNSTKNKGTLWNLMYENGLFDGIESKFVNNVKTDFEKKISQISLNISQVDNLTILNKQVIADMMNNILKYKNTESSPQLPQPPPLITSTDITEQRQKVFNNVLLTKKNEFDSMMNKNVPNKIDFSDVADKPIGSEMDKILAETIAWREKQLNVVLETQDQKEASAWINREQDKDSNNKSSIKNIKIGQPTILDNENIVNLKKPVIEKRVNFDLSSDTKSKNDYINTDNFLSMLKQKSNDNTDINQSTINSSFEEIKSMLSEIINNQKLILACLGKESQL
jgi:hypothetical protein